MGYELISNYFACPKCRQFTLRTDEFYMRCTTCDKKWSIRSFLHHNFNMPHRLISKLKEGNLPLKVLRIYKYAQMNQIRLHEAWQDNELPIIQELKEKLIEPNKSILKFKLGLNNKNELVIPKIMPVYNELMYEIKVDDGREIWLAPTILNTAVLVSKNFFNALNYVSLGYQSVICDVYADISYYQANYTYNRVLEDRDYIDKATVSEYIESELSAISFRSELRKRIPPINIISTSKPVLKYILQYKGSGSTSLLKFYLYILVNNKSFIKERAMKFLGVKETAIENMMKVLRNIKKCSITRPNVLGRYHFNQEIKEPHVINFRALNIIEDEDALKIYLYLHSCVYGAGIQGIKKNTNLSDSRIIKALNKLDNMKYIEDDGSTIVPIKQKIPYDTGISRKIIKSI